MTKSLTLKMGFNTKSGKDVTFSLPVASEPDADKVKNLAAKMIETDIFLWEPTVCIGAMIERTEKGKIF